VKLPFLQFYPADYMVDTRILTLAARGAWVDILCVLHGSSTRGIATFPALGWARIMGASVAEFEAVISEIEAMGVGNVIRDGNGNITVTCRRMTKESITREQTRLRVQNHRNKERNAASNAPGNAPVTPNKLEVISHKLEDKATPYPCPTSAKPASDDEAVKKAQAKKAAKEAAEAEAMKEGERFVTWFLDLLRETEAPEPSLTDSIRAGWARTYVRMIGIDGRTKADVKEICQWARNDPFWRRNFLSPAKLRQRNDDGVMWFDAFATRARSPEPVGQRQAPPPARIMGPMEVLPERHGESLLPPDWTPDEEGTT
jgi:hypothetical protein